MAHSITLYILLIALIVLLIMAAEKLKIAYPILLVLGGLIISIIPGIPALSVSPELIFTIFLPPLLYEAAWYTSWKEFWKWRRIISSFAFIIVLFTSLIVAWITNLMIPGFTLALGFLLGGIVSPPDAVSASAILKNISVPKRISAILEGESLLNDASSLVVFRFSLIAVSTGSFVFQDAAGSFVWIITIGILCGIAVAYTLYFFHRLLPTNVNTDIIITLITPYLLFITAETIHVSGVLSVVSGGLLLSSKRQFFLTHSSRLQGASVWSVVGFILNGFVFMIIGLQLPIIVSNLGETSFFKAIFYGIVITLLLMLLRVACALGASVFTTFISRYIQTADSRPGWKAPLIFGWAGMRGVVSLAAALSIPVFLKNGEAFPHRNLILFITFVVILLTLLVQGLTLPLLIRGLQLDDPDHYLPPDLQQRKMRNKLAVASKEYLKTNYESLIENNVSARLLIEKFDQDLITINGNAVFYAAYIDLLNEQRKWLWEWNKDIQNDDEVIRKFLLLIDMEEEKIKNLMV